MEDQNILEETLTDFFIDNDLIKDSSYSFRDKDITLTYDNKFNDYYYDDDQVSMKKWKTKDLNVNLVFDNSFHMKIVSML